MKLCLQFCFFLTLLIAACTPDNQSNSPTGPSFEMGLLGAKWEVERGFRNNKFAPSLDGLFFDFSTKDSMTTNLIGQGLPESYVIKGDTIKTDQLYFLVSKLDSMRLVLETNLQATPFRFQLKKAHISEDSIE